MMHTYDTSNLVQEEKLDYIIAVSFSILKSIIADGSFQPQNEASFQLYFSNILLNIGRMIVIGENEIFKVELESPIILKEKTSKCPDKNARCDIVCEIVKDAKVEERAFVEIKHFLNGRDCSTDNRFSVWEDIENLEHYKADIANLSKLSCYLVVYAEEDKYSSYLRNHNYSICNGHEIAGTQSYNKKAVSLTGRYYPNWDGRLLLLKIN